MSRRIIVGPHGRFARCWLGLRPSGANLLSQTPRLSQPPLRIGHPLIGKSAFTRFYSQTGSLSKTAKPKTEDEADEAKEDDPDPDQLLEEPAAIESSQTPSTANERISCIYFQKSDPLASKYAELTKTEIAAQFDLRYRDLRDIDLRSEAVTRILVRPATILVQFFDLCIIIQADEALLVNGITKDTTNSNSATNSAGTGTKSTSVLEHDFKRRLVGFNSSEATLSSDLPYELRAVEAALVAVLSTLREELIDARKKAEHSARELRLESGLAAVGIDLLFERSRRLGQIEQKARLVRETIREVLDTDEDLASMYLTDTRAGKPHAVSDHQEAEYMLEAYHKAADALVESAAGAIGVIRRKENTFRSALAVQRNQIMFLEARIAIHTLGLAAGTLVAGLFGMNLVNHAEDSTWGFPAVTSACIILSALFSIYGARKLRRIQTLREIQGYRGGRR
ncbi:hypothetical protein A1O1_04304 [Capronia coronata CBS 617.96]|uniref:Magnesium transporter n=1 Tax=Capronia coronata CBS 617.96 TaxID=1182541 RepID=W9YND8_9EURO|nr:uncharacterized protein A1O1_04304 [Capronia coronata CBS 617.96]EXJ91195.1 hypothetical protein A1O1_04304 [Capronia coronata CBS 617.96]